MFSPYVGIVPYTRFCCPKPRIPLTETITDEKELFPNTLNKENEIEPTDVV
jgi:hypothetical protein